jgi:outer membrane lipoprotein SlyB
MKKPLLAAVLAASILATGPLAALALGTNEKGCLVGGAVGGVAGHALSGNKTLLGAAVGCGAGVLINKERVKKVDAKKEADKKRQEAAARKRQYTQR